MDKSVFTTPLWLSTTWNFNGIITILSFTFGMYVVWFKSPKEMMQYKHALGAIVFYTSVFDSVINFVFRPVALFPLWGGFTDSVFAKLFGQALEAMGILDGDATYFVPLIQLACYEAFVSLLCGFLFRYWSLKRDNWVIQTVVRHYLVTFPVHMSTTIPCPILCALARPPRAAMVSYIHEKHPEFSPLVNHSMWVIINPDIGGGNAWSTAYGYCSVSIGIFYVIAGTITLHMIIQNLNKIKDHMSVKTYKLHKSLVVSLCWQAVVPIVMYVIPLVSAVLILFFQLEKQTQGWMNIFFAVMGTHSIINVCLMTYFTKPYREFAMGIFNRFGVFTKRARKVDTINTCAASHITIRQVLID